MVFGPDCGGAAAVEVEGVGKAQVAGDGGAFGDAGAVGLAGNPAVDHYHAHAVLATAFSGIPHNRTRVPL